LLHDPSGRLWMSDTPQERIMMYNNGRRSRGHVLVGGLGLGLYPQYAERGAVGQATRFTIIERSPVIRDIVAPMLHATLAASVEISIGDVAAYLAEPATVRFDTIFLDTWETLDATHLPAINRLRNMALAHLAPDGQVHLWGYHWMTRLFEEACNRLLSIAPGQRREWLFSQAATNPRAVALLEPVVDHFDGQCVNDLTEALRWCRHYVLNRTQPL
jgi:spermidine synthase